MEGAIGKALLNECFQCRCFNFDSHAFNIRQPAVPGQIWGSEGRNPGTQEYGAGTSFINEISVITPTVRIRVGLSHSSPGQKVRMGNGAWLADYTFFMVRRAACRFASIRRWWNNGQHGFDSFLPGYQRGRSQGFPSECAGQRKVLGSNGTESCLKGRFA
jgi:hypothetical protein